MSERVMIFIDGSNLYHSLKQYCGKTNVNFEMMCDRLAQQRKLVRAYYYNAAIDQQLEPTRYKDQQRFFARMRRIPKLEVRLGTLVYRNNFPAVPPYEKGIDVRLATDMLVHAMRQNYDTAILVSGDTDFADALQAVKDLGRNVEVALFGNPTSSNRLRDVADDLTNLDPAFFAGCWI